MRKSLCEQNCWTGVRGVGTCVLLALTVVMAACELSPPGPLPNSSPDAMERIRATDLQPRFPQHSQTVDTAAANSPRASVYRGDIVTSAVAKARPAQSGGEGYELNFEN